MSILLKSCTFILLFIQLNLQTLKAYLVRAFIKNNCGGSPTGVVLNATGLNERRMQFIATQLPASHTAFVFEPTNPGGNVQVRFFTRGAELLNCGHGTIAAHYVRAKSLNLTHSMSYYQEVKEGMQQVEVIKMGDDLQVYLRINEIKFTEPKPEAANNLLNALGIGGDATASDYPLVLASPGSYRFLVGLKSIEILNTILPDFDKLKQVCNEHKSMGCFAYAIGGSSSNPEAAARMFAPAIGVNEDIINGNSSACLGAYLLHLNTSNSLDLLVSQGNLFNSEGLVMVKARKIDNNTEVSIGGKAKIEKELLIRIE